ncbi:DUF3105 domain-containing protein [Nocardioides piscis]|uniref:DUF3105 domain-containing protein n=1 Tax=Nocardioides piscis TaxID=2714938 RepID=A0A6G7YHP9_9ACTN|nr:DUF3105 domain-containing protein [Nocardioides piscis]QIK76345.1 DUF3105 domain-containing protein [Nocardioides piscis]
MSETAPLPEPTRPGRFVLAAAVTMALALVAAALLVPRLVHSLEPPDLDEVAVHDGLPLDHVSGDVDYPVTPPVGGPHAQRWLECGVYDEEVPPENAVHALEHGTVWITHEPGLGSGDVARLVDQLPEEGILSPYDGLPGPVVVTVWGRQLVLDGADDERLGLFLAEYGDGHTAPEPMASCHGGVDADGGTARPA